MVIVKPADFGQVMRIQVRLDEHTLLVPMSVSAIGAKLTFRAPSRQMA